MSPNEKQLRAALREGEGERLDPDAVLARVARVRHERRRRFVAGTGGLAAAGLVIASAVTFVALSGHDSDNSAGNGVVPVPTRTSAPSTVRTSATSGPATATVSPLTGTSRNGLPAGTFSCPKVPERLMLPGGGGSGQFGSTGTLFPSGVVGLRACLYGVGSTGGAYSSSLTVSAYLTGADASSVVSALDEAPAAGVPSHVCPDHQTQDSTTRTVRLAAVTGSGVVGRPVVITVSCTSIMATNGTAVRYLRTLPGALQHLLR